MLERGDAADVLSLVAPLDDYWISRPYHAEVRRWLEAGLTDPDAVPAGMRLAALHLLVVVDAMLGDHAAAVAQAEEALAVADDIGGAFARGRAFFYLGFAWEQRGDGARSAAYHEQAAPLLVEAGIPHWAALGVGELGDKRLWIGDAAGAAPLLDDAIARNRAAGYAFGLAMALGQRGYAATALGDTATAVRLFDESMRSAREIGAERIVLGALAGLAGVALAGNDPDRAARILGAVAAARAALRVGRIAHALHTERIESETRARLGETAFADAFASGEALALDEAVALALEPATPRRDTPGGDPTRVALSPREQEVLALLVQGLTDRAIADALFIGERTVNSHVARLYGKLGVRSRAAAVSAALGAGLVEMPAPAS